MTHHLATVISCGTSTEEQLSTSDTAGPARGAKGNQCRSLRVGLRGVEN